MLKRLYHPLIIIPCFVLLFIGCQDLENQKAFSSDNSTKPTISQSLAKRMENEVERMEEVEQVRAVSLDKDVFMFLEVTGFDRFFLEKIRKEAFKKAKGIDDQAKVHVSTDQKIRLEIEKMEDKIQSGKIDKKQLRKELDKLEDDMKG